MKISIFRIIRNMLAVGLTAPTPTTCSELMQITKIHTDFTLRAESFRFSNCNLINGKQPITEVCRLRTNLNGATQFQLQ